MADAVGILPDLDSQHTGDATQRCTAKVRLEWPESRVLELLFLARNSLRSTGTIRRQSRHPCDQYV